MDFKKYLGLIGCAALVLIFAVFSIYWVFLHRGEQSGPQSGGYSAACGNIPEPYNSLFDKAATKYDIPVALLAAIFSCGEHGGTWPKNPYDIKIWGESSKHAKGPFQFTDATWQDYGVDGDGDGKKDVQNLTDAAYSAANMLSANIKSNSGTYEEKIKKAIYRYNPAQWYVDKVYSCYLKFSCIVTAGANGCYDPGALMKVYGSTRAEVEAQLVTVNFVGRSVKFHKKAAPYLEAVSRDIINSGTNYKIRRVGTYAWRPNVNDPNKLSLHSFGIAIDINDDTNPNGSSKTDIPPEVSNAFKRHGFKWGLEFSGKKDPMHFEFRGYDCAGNLIIK